MNSPVGGGVYTLNHRLPGMTVPVARCADVHCIRHASSQDDARLAQIAEEFAVQAFIAQLIRGSSSRRPHFY